VETAYNRTEDGIELKCPVKAKGRRSLSDEAVIRLRRNEERLTTRQWSTLYQVPYIVIWNAQKGYTYRHLNWIHPPKLKA